MKLGLLSACMPERSLEEVAAWAGEHGFEALELAAWPRLGDRPFVARPAADEFDEAEAERVRTALYDNGLELSALAYYDNNLHPDLEQRREIHDHLRACVDAQRRSGDPVGTFVAATTSLSVAENLREAERVFPPLVDYAGERGVKLMIENCVMEGWHPDGYPGNLAYSPELWEWMFELGLWLNFDPSHLLWIGIEPIAACAPTSTGSSTRTPRTPRRSWTGATALGSSAASRPARPTRGTWAGGGSGSRDSGRSTGARYVDALYEGGHGVLSVEHEDPVWGGSPEKVQAGLEIAQRNLRPLLV